MTTLTENLSKVQDQILETLTSFQEPVVKLVRTISEAAEQRVPDVPELPASDKLPGVQEFVDNQFAFAERILKNQHEFATALIEAAKPVTDKATPAPKPVAKKTKAAAAAA